MRRLLHLRQVFIVGGLMGLMTGCAFSPLRHLEGVPASVERLKPGERNETRASDDVAEASADGLFVGVALAGGGSRAAVFSGEVLCRLQEMGVMKRVDFVSGISAGSMAGAYYCLSRDAGDARTGDLIWQRSVVEEQMRRGAWLKYLAGYLFSPWNLVRYYGTGLNRSYQMRRVLDQNYFHNRTLAELNPRRPRLLVTATTLESGAVFTFTDQQLAERGIQSSSFKISDTVQASSAFPGLFHPYVLPDYTVTNDGPRSARFVHLVDGGVYDNLGVVPLLKIYQANREQFSRGGMIIVADASMPVEVKAKLATFEDTRAMTDYVLDFSTILKSIEIMFEVDRLGLMRALREDTWHLGLTLIHLHYTTGLLSEDGAMQDGLPNILDLDQPVPTNVDFKAKKELVAPTAMGISEKHAQATRDAARHVIEFHRNELNALAGDR